MKLKAIEIEGPIKYPFIAFCALLGYFYIVILSPFFLWGWLIHLKRKWRGPDAEWRTCFAWHPVPVPRDGWYWWQTMQYRAFSVLGDVEYRHPTEDTEELIE